jgi:riboflavin synthase
MFTGIVTAIGTVRAVEAPPGGDRVFHVEAPWSSAGLVDGASVCHSGVCLTVLDVLAPPGGGCRWRVQASAETLALSTAAGWQQGTGVNLERALRVGDELGGHFVAGHVDAVGEVVSVTPENESHRVRIRAPRPLHRYLAPKGSVAVDGVSLTVNEVEDDVFGINVIPHTWAVTTLGAVRPGARVNLEIDPIARYAARWMETAS